MSVRTADPRERTPFLPQEPDQGCSVIPTKLRECDWMTVSLRALVAQEDRGRPGYRVRPWTSEPELLWIYKELFQPQEGS